ncbi:peptide synthetase, partial [Streptomyces sp. NPDC058427]
MSRSQAKACHSLVVRVPAPVDAAEILRRLCAGAAGSWPQTADRIRLWEETLPFDAGHPAARHRIAVEARRPVRAGGPPMRAVLVRYAGGDADLVLVARHELTFDEPRFTFGRNDSATLPREDPTPVEWGLGDPARAGR